MRWIVLPKIAFWLVVIGVLALIAPDPAWPEWLAQMAIATGVALGITTFGVRLYELRKSSMGPRGGSEGKAD